MFALKVVEWPERVVEVVVADLAVLDIETLEDRLIEQAPLLFVAASVEFFGGFEELEGGLYEPSAVGQVSAGGVEALGEAPSFSFDFTEFGFNLGLRKCAVGGQVNQVLLLCVEFAQLAGDLLV